jgi:superfamily II DNA helicase RecQ
VQDREVTQQEFSTGRLKVIVATIAFGMGMDISNVRSVIHLNLPRSLEDYVQQVSLRAAGSFPGLLP